MPAIHAETLLTAIESIRLNHLMQSQKRGRIHAILARWMLKVPGTPKIILCTSTTNCWKILIPIHIKFDLAFAPPARCIGLPCKIGPNILTFALHAIQQGMHLLVSQRIAASPLHMKIGGINGDVG